MTSITRSVQILINTNLQAAFDYVSDLTKHPEWSGGELRLEAVSSEPIQVGKEYVSKGEFAIQKERPNKLKVTEFEPPRKFGFVANDPTIGDVFHTFTFVEKGNQVLITRAIRLNLNPFMAFGFTLFVYPLTGNPSMKKAFRNLKARLENAD
ncbi:MAG: SRPBCC family protein [Anaerolineales bacterium]|nr:SRPBCC family protein [Anaerolineales bacterium]